MALLSTIVQRDAGTQRIRARSVQSDLQKTNWLSAYSRRSHLLQHLCLRTTRRRQVTLLRLQTRTSTIGLLTAGIIPTFKHCLDSLLIHNPVLIPANATVFGKAIEFRTEDVCGFDMSAINQYRYNLLFDIYQSKDATCRWSPFFTCGLPLSPEHYKDLSDVFEVWHFDFYNPPEETARKVVDLTFTSQGIFNAMLFWYELDLGNGITFSTAPKIVQNRSSSSLQPSVQFMAGELQVEEGTVHPLVCSHNTVRWILQKPLFLNLLAS